MGASETDETRATGGTARATTTHNNPTHETVEPDDDIGAALDAIAGDNRRLLSAAEQNLFVELSAEIEQAKRSGPRSQMGALVAQIRRKRQAKMAAIREQAAIEAAGKRRLAKQQQAKRRRVRKTKRPQGPAL